MKRLILIFILIVILSGIAQAGCVTRYFVVPAENVSRYTAILFPDNDYLPLSDLKVIPGPILQDGRQIVKAELPPYLIKIMAESVADYGIEDPLTPEGVVALDIAGSFAGRTRAEVIARWPELAGQTCETVDGVQYCRDKMPYQIWSCEE